MLQQKGCIVRADPNATTVDTEGDETTHEMLVAAGLTAERAEGVLEMKENEKVDMVDMNSFQIKLKRGHIAMEFLNQCLKEDSEYVMDNSDEE